MNDVAKRISDPLAKGNCNNGIIGAAEIGRLEIENEKLRNKIRAMRDPWAMAFRETITDPEELRQFDNVFSI